jgi:hypothetical protein
MRRLILLVVGLAAALVLVPTTAVADSTTGTTLTHWCPSPTPSDPQKHPAHDGRDAAGDPVHRPLDLDERNGRAPGNLHK